jgi:hypothetical protein
MRIPGAVRARALLQGSRACSDFLVVADAWALAALP